MRRLAEVASAAALALALFGAGCGDGKEAAPAKGKAAAAPTSPAGPRPSGSPALPPAVVPHERLKALLPTTVAGYEIDQSARNTDSGSGTYSTASRDFKSGKPDATFSISVVFDGSEKRSPEACRDAQAADTKGKTLTICGFPAWESEPGGILQTLQIYAGYCSVQIIASANQAALMEEVAGKMDLAAFAKLGG